MVAMMVLRSVNRSASRLVVLSDRAASEARTAILGQLRDARPSVEPGHETWKLWFGGAVRPLRSVEGGALVAGVATGVMLPVLLVGLAPEFRELDDRLTRVVLYLVLFRVAAGDARKLARLVTALNLAYPLARRCHVALATGQVTDDAARTIQDDHDDRGTEPG